MNKDELLSLAVKEYKNRGNSMNGAQLQMIERKLDRWIHAVGIEETAKVLINDFDIFHFGGSLI